MLIVRFTCLLLSILKSAESLFNFERKPKREFGSAIRAVLVDLFLDVHAHVNIISSAHESQLDGFISHLIQNASMASSITFTMNCLVSRSKTNLMFVDSRESFENISSFITSHSLYVIVMMRGKLVDAQEVFKACQMKKVLDAFVLFEMRGKVVISTYDPFASNDCQSASPRVISKGQPIVSRSLNNFHQCPLSFGAYINPPCIMCNNLICSLEELRGRDIVLLKTLSTALNFTTQLETFRLRQFTQSIALLNDGRFDAILGDFYLRHDRNQIVDASTPYFDSDIALLVPRGRPFTSLESLLKPFQPVVWALLAIIIIIALLVITIIKLQSIIIQKFVFGIDHPTMSLVAVVYGLTLHKLPTRNFARFLLISFIVLCLIMRTLYQGSVYKFLQSDMRHKVAETIDDMVREDFKFYVLDMSSSMVVDERIKNSSIRPINDTQRHEVFERLNDPSFKGTLLRSRQIATYLQHTNRSKYRFVICKEVFVHIPVVLYFQQNSFLTCAFNAKLHQLMSGGFIDYWNNELKRKSRSKPVGPKTLTMTHLVGIFQIWCSGCLLATMAFIVEHVFFNVDRISS